MAFLKQFHDSVSKSDYEALRSAFVLGDVPFLSLQALHQLHIFIFVLGLVHVIFCATTILLGGAKMRKWKHWETRIHGEIQQKSQQTNSAQNVTLVNAVLHRDHLGKFVSERTKGFCMELAVVSWMDFTSIAEDETRTSLS